MELLDSESLLEYSLGEGVVAFSTRRCSSIPEDILMSRQVHGCNVAVIDEMPAPGAGLDGYDAIVTSLRGLAIGVRTADCVPILLYDRVRGAVAAIHSGWDSLYCVQEQPTCSIYGNLILSGCATSTRTMVWLFIASGFTACNKQIDTDIKDTFNPEGHNYTWWLRLITYTK